MTRSEGTTLLALLTIIATSVAGLAAAVTLGVRDEDSPPALTSGPVVHSEGVEVVAETVEPAVEDRYVDEALARAAMNSIHGAPAPAAPEAWGRGSEEFERFRSWEGELTLWQGNLPQIILGPAGNWFPAGQPGCGDGVHLVAFEAPGGEPLTAELRDGAGTPVRVGDPAGGAEGWMLADDCHLPYVQLFWTPEGPASAQVSYTVHEYEPVDR